LTAQPTTPRIWRVLGDKRGDNGQVERVARALEERHGWQSTLRHLEMQPKFVEGKPRVGPTLYHLDLARSAPLEPPWPDLILTSGRRPANAALWIKQQSCGKTRIVLMGKPSGWMAHFDLIVTSAETLPAPYDNVLHIGLPLMDVDPARLEEGAARWRTNLAPLPRPLTAFLIGGPTNPFRYTPAVQARLRRRIEEVLGAGGTAYLVGSRRTPPGFMAGLARGFDGRVQVFDWAQGTGENPYAGLLALADRFVVTGDSISMQVEVVRLGKPLEIIPLPTGWLGKLDNGRRRLSAWLFQPRRDERLAETARIALARLLYQLKLLPQTRHFPAFHQMLIDRGLASWIGQDDLSIPETAPAPPATRPDTLETDADMARILMRIDALLAPEGTSGGRS
jgi:mitochondrial fission protein ELM1